MNWSTPRNTQLVRALLSLKTSDEARRFLRDLLTPDEIDEFAKRFQTAEMLSKKVPYSVIEEKTGLSSTTVARVSKWLNGREGGYRRVIGRMHHHSSPLARGDCVAYMDFETHRWNPAPSREGASAMCLSLGGWKDNCSLRQ